MECHIFAFAPRNAPPATIRGGLAESRSELNFDCFFEGSIVGKSTFQDLELAAYAPEGQS